MEMAEATSKPPKNDDFDLNDLSLEAIQAAQEEEEATATAVEEEKNNFTILENVDKCTIFYSVKFGASEC